MVMRALDWSHTMAQIHSTVTKIYIQICECHTDHTDISTVCVIYIDITFMSLLSHWRQRFNICQLENPGHAETLGFPAVQVATKPGIFKPKHYLFLTLSEVIMPNKVFKGPLCKEVDFSVRFQASQILTTGDFRLCWLPCQGVELGSVSISWEKTETFCSTNLELEHKDMYGSNMSMVCLTFILVNGSGH